MSLGHGSAMSSWGGTSGLPGLGFFCRCFGVVLQMLSIWIWDTLGRGEASSCLFSWVQEREECRSFQGQPRQRGQPDSKGCPLQLHGPVLLGLAVTLLVARLPHTLCFVRKVDPASPAPITDQTVGRRGCRAAPESLPALRGFPLALLTSIGPPVAKGAQAEMPVTQLKASLLGEAGNIPPSSRSTVRAG